MLVEDKPTVCAKCGGFNPDSCKDCRLAADEKDERECPWLFRAVNEFIDTRGSTEQVVERLCKELNARYESPRATRGQAYCIYRLERFITPERKLIDTSPKVFSDVLGDGRPIVERVLEWVVREYDETPNQYTGPGYGMLAEEPPEDKARRREDMRLFNQAGKSLRKTRP